MFQISIFFTHFMTFRIIWAQLALSWLGHVAITRPRRDNVSFRFMHVATAIHGCVDVYIYIYMCVCVASLAHARWNNNYCWQIQSTIEKTTRDRLRLLYRGTGEYRYSLLENGTEPLIDIFSASWDKTQVHVCKINLYGAMHIVRRFRCHISL